MVGLNGRFLWPNHAAASLFGRSRSELIGTSLTEVTHPSDLDLMSVMLDIIREGALRSSRFEIRYLGPNSETILALSSLSLVRSAQDTPLSFLWEAEDIDERNGPGAAGSTELVLGHNERDAAEGGERRAEALFETVFHESTVGSAVATLENRWLVVNEALCEFLGRSAEDLLRLGPAGVTHPDDLDSMREAHSALVQGAGPAIRRETRYLRGDGEVVWGLLSSALIRGEAGNPRAIQSQIIDVTDRKHSGDMRRSLLGSLAEGVWATDADGLVTFVNPAAERLLGYRKAELLGRSAHDALLRHADAGSIEECPFLGVRRTGGPVRVEDGGFVHRDGHVIPAAYSAAPLSGDGLLRGVVVTFSDITERRAKEQQLHRRVEVLDTLDDIRDALTAQRFVLYSQPILDLRTRTVVQEELLLRLRAPDGTIVPPMSFLPVAEQFGLIHDIDRWVIGEAAGIAATGRHVQVNISASTLGHPDLTAWVEDAITTSGADPRLLTFEITETAAAEDLNQACRFASRIAEVGCGFALDDFGTGYGSFIYLKTLPISYLKIDIQFVRDLLEDAANRHLVAAVVRLARDFGQRTIAEGVEDSETLALLHEMGVDFAQGYVIGRPTPADSASPVAQWPIPE